MNCLRLSACSLILTSRKDNMHNKDKNDNIDTTIQAKVAAEVSQVEPREESLDERRLLLRMYHGPNVLTFH